MSAADKFRLAGGVAAGFLIQLALFGYGPRVYALAAACIAAAFAIAFVIAGRTRPRNWKRISIWFLCLSILLPPLTFLLLFQFREGF